MANGKRASIVVGVDGSDGARTALEWAAAEAAARGVPLRIVHATLLMPHTELTRVYGEIPQVERDRIASETHDLLEAARARVAELAPKVTVTVADTDGPPASALLAESLHADMVVVGSRKLGGLGSLVLGSVGSVLAQRAACPVIVVRGPSGDPAEGARVVVGVDGRTSADAALEFAFAHASARGLPVDAVLCWPPDPLTEMSWRAGSPAPEQADRFLAEAISGWRDKYPDVVVNGSVVREFSVAGLVAASTAQDLLVVGRHGRHHVPGVTLGSTTMGVLHHATCPVAVVPEV